MAHFSFTRLSADTCALNKKNQESISPFLYKTNSEVMENKASCFLPESPFMHNHFNSIPANMVDYESELRGQTRPLSNCPENNYLPNSQKPIDFSWNLCNDRLLVPEYTRIDKPCNIFSGININRFDILCHDPQNMNNIHSNSYIGTNTRNSVKDAFDPKLYKAGSCDTGLCEPRNKSQ